MRAQKPELATAPAADLLTLAEVKEYLRIESDDEDTLLASLIEAATFRLDGYSGLLGRALITQSWMQKFDSFPDGDRIPIPIGRLQSVTSIAYFDESESSASFLSYHTISEPGGAAIVLQDGATWPTTATRPDAVTVTWVAGYGNAAADVPEIIRIAGLQLVAHLYAKREAVTDANMMALPHGFEGIVSSMRDFGG